MTQKYGVIWPIFKLDEATQFFGMQIDRNEL